MVISTSTQAFFYDLLIIIINYLFITVILLIE